MHYLMIGLLCLGCQYGEEQHDYKSIHKNGMELKWRIVDKQLECIVMAPTKGWIAIGFNPETGLVQTNLIMAMQKAGESIVSDRYIVAVGVHKAVEELGGKTALKNPLCTEKNGQTILQFSISLESIDQYHHQLKEGKIYHILLAYSHHDDFGHHSTMRTSIQIQL